MKRLIAFALLLITTSPLLGQDLPEEIRLAAKRTISHSPHLSELVIVVNPAEQKLYLVRRQEQLELVRVYPISTSRFGLGFQEGSNKTPTGTHQVSEKIGEGQPLGMIFRGRKPIKVAKIITEPVDLEQDDVTTRILWLTGLEEGNRNSHQRFIYIHGTPEEGLLGRPASHGCIRMRNTDVVELFDLVSIGTLVEIINQPYQDKEMKQ